MTATAAAAAVAQALQATARAHADKPAIRAHHGGIEWCWDDYHQRVRTCGAVPHRLNASQQARHMAVITPDYEGLMTTPPI